MKELIERRAAIEAVDTGNLHRGIVEALQNIISELPSVQRWIPVKYRQMTEEEREYWSDVLDYELDDNSMFDCQMPDDGQKILVCSKCGNIWIDTHEDDGGLMGLEENGDWEGIVAWMPLPEPFKEVE